MFVAPFFAIAKIWKQLWYIYSMQHYLAVKIKKRKSYLL